MARRFERHARSKSDWDGPGARSAEVQAAAATGLDPSRRAPARKDTRSWCRGKPGRQHVHVIEYRPDYFSARRGIGCEWGASWRTDGKVVWRCLHKEECSACGKVLRESWQLPVAECPAYPGSGEQREHAEAEAVASRERADAWSAQRVLRRPVIDGPQGFRRKRQEVS